MTHWAERYVGTLWSESFDCADLVARVQSEQFGREVALPGHFDWRKTTPETVVSLAEDVVVPTDAPVEGDAILMRIRGSKIDLGSHVGIYAEVGGTPWCLHNLEKVNTLFHPLTSIARLQLSVVGFFTWE